MKIVKAFAPASVANVAVGFDLLGFSANVAGDIVTIEKIDSNEIEITAITGTGAPAALPRDPAKNTATAGLIQLRKDLNLKFGFKVSIEKGIPLGSGMGGSAASAVAAIVAANAFLDKPLTREQLVAYALIGEAQASGSYHADNIAPSLYGGLTLARVRTHQAERSVEVLQLPIPNNLYAVLCNPALEIETKSARGVLKKDLSLHAHIEQSANLAGVMAGCYTGDLELIKRSLADVIVEPQRAHLIPGFLAVKTAALQAGALGCSIAGAGPSVFAWADGKAAAEKVHTAMLHAFTAANVGMNNSWAFELTTISARIVS